MKKGQIVLFVIGILLICFSGIMGRTVSWNINVDKDTCYSMGVDSGCAKNIADLTQGGFADIITKYYNDVQTISGIFRSIGIVISTISGIFVFTKNTKVIKKEFK